MELEKQRQAAQEILEKRENQFKEKIHELEGRILQEREERTYSDQKVAELARWRQDVEQIHISSGIPLSMSALQLQRIETKDSDRESNRLVMYCLRLVFHFEFQSLLYTSVKSLTLQHINICLVRV